MVPRVMLSENKQTVINKENYSTSKTPKKVRKIVNYLLFLFLIIAEQGWHTVANVRKNVIMKFQSNPLSHFQDTRTYKNFNQIIQSTKFVKK